MMATVTNGSGKGCDDFVVTVMVVIAMVMMVMTVMVMMVKTVVIVMVLVEVNNSWWNIFCNQKLNSLHHTNLRLQFRNF